MKSTSFRFNENKLCLFGNSFPRTDWPTAKLVLGDMRFLDRLMDYPKDDISDRLLKRLQEYVNHPEFRPDLVAKQSKACKSLSIWVKAIDGYAKVYRVVEPKRLR